MLSLTADRCAQCYHSLPPHTFIRMGWIILYLIISLSTATGWLGSRVISALDSGAEGPGFKSQPRRCRVTVLGKLLTPIVPLFTKQQNWVAGVTAGLAESNGSLPPGLWLTSPACWLPRTGISSGTLRSAIEYGLPSPFTTVVLPSFNISDDT